MNHTLLSIRLLCVFIFSFFVNISNLLAVDYFRHTYIIEKTQNNIEKLSSKRFSCKKSRDNNFQDKTPEERMVLIYLNTILNKILSSNKDIIEKTLSSNKDIIDKILSSDNKDILKIYTVQISDFCITLDKIGFSPFGSEGLGLIVADPNLIYIQSDQKFINDSEIAVALSHEIAHELLFHRLKIIDKELQIYDTSSFKNKYININEYNFDGDLTNVDDYIRFFEKYDKKLLNPKVISRLDIEHKKWNKFCISSNSYLEFIRSLEIEADNLGLQLYLNTEFNPEHFSKFCISNEYCYDDIDIDFLPDFLKKIFQSALPSSNIPDIFKTISQGDNYIVEGQRARKEGRFNEFMESIKYEEPTDTHPSDFWRYWNIRIQTEEYKNNNKKLNTSMSNSLYFRIDLSKSEKLDILKTFFSNKDNINIPLTNTQDPRFYIIDKLFNPSSSALPYTLESLSDTSDVGIIHNDNTILLRANDIFQIVLVKKSNDFDDLIFKHCRDLFSKQNEQLFFSAIEKAFL